MKQTRLFFTAARLPVDYLALIAAAMLAYFIRFESLKDIRPVIYEIPFDLYRDYVSLIAFGWVAIFALNGLYSTNKIKISKELTRVITGCATGFVAILFYLVFKQELFSSRFILLSTFLAAIIFVATSRIILRAAERILFALGFGTTNLVLVGSVDSRLIFNKIFKAKPGLGYRGTIEFEKLDEEAIKDIKKHAKAGKVDGILITDPQTSTKENLDARNLSNDLHINFFYSADLFTTASTNIAVHNFNGTPVIEIKKTRLDGWWRIIKRIFDFFFALILVVVTLPLTLFSFIAILIETGRPVFFKNERVGENGKIFDLLKFRSMYQKHSIGKQFGKQEEALRFEEQLIKENSLKEGPVYKILNDPRITPLGKFIRRWSIDELPQLLNVLSGNMSLVGPRPHQPREVEKYSRHHHRVLDIKPGLTGLAQTSGRSDLDFEEEVRLDTYYIENWSIWLDLVILIKTPFVVLAKKGAY